MVEDKTVHSAVAAFEPAMAAIVDWLRLCRIALGARDELAAASPAEVVRIAGELGVYPPELAPAVARWPDSAALHIETTFTRMDS